MVHTLTRLPQLTFSFACALTLTACGGSQEPAVAPQQGKPETSITSIACPNLTNANSDLDLTTLFGIDAALDARLDRVLGLASELDKTVSALEEDAKEACRIVARDLGAVPNDVQHPCETVVTRLDAIRASIGSGGFSVSVSNLSCGVSLTAVETCAGECLTGMPGVTSAVACAAPATNPEQTARCGLDFALPHASSCATQCGARALREVDCSADVDIRIGNGETPAQYLAMVEDLRRDLPKLAGLAASVGPRAAHLATEVKKLIDDVAASIDALRDVGNSAQQRAVAGAVLAGCVGPRLADVIRSSAELETSLSGALQAHALLTAR